MVELENMRASMAEILSIPLSELHDDTVLEASGNWDSLAMMGTVALVFETTRATVSREEIGELVTLRDIFDLATRKMQKAA
jgi:acyl carrier protein